MISVNQINLLKPIGSKQMKNNNEVKASKLGKTSFLETDHDETSLKEGRRNSEFGQISELGKLLENLGTSLGNLESSWATFCSYLGKILSEIIIDSTAGHHFLIPLVRAAAAVSIHGSFSRNMNIKMGEGIITGLCSLIVLGC